MSDSDQRRPSPGQTGKTGFFGSGQKSVTPRKSNPALVETAEMPVPTNTIQYNDPTTPFQLLLLNLFRASVARTRELNESSRKIGTPEGIGRALAELVKAANPEAQAFFNANYDSAFTNPDALFHAYVGLEQALNQSFDYLNTRRVRKKVAAGKDMLSYDTEFKGIATRFHLRFSALPTDDEKRGAYSQVVAHFQKSMQAGGGSMGGVSRAYDIVRFRPVSEGGWLKKAKTIPSLDAMVKDPKDYYDAGGIFLLSDIIHVEQRLRPVDAVKAIAAVKNNYERRNWILTEILSLPERIRTHYDA